MFLWELWSRGRMPYPGMTAAETMLAVGMGRRLERPEPCPKSVYALMRRMWAVDPTTRPAFSEITAALSLTLGVEADTNYPSTVEPCMDGSYVEPITLNEPSYLQPVELAYLEPIRLQDTLLSETIAETKVDGHGYLILEDTSVA